MRATAGECVRRRVCARLCASVCACASRLGSCRLIFSCGCVAIYTSNRSATSDVATRYSVCCNTVPSDSSMVSGPPPHIPSRYAHAPKRPPLRIAVHRFRLHATLLQPSRSALPAIAHLGVAARAVLISCALAVRSRPARAEWRAAQSVSGWAALSGRTGPERTEGGRAAAFEAEVSESFRIAS